jgi:hypothetical protein
MISACKGNLTENIHLLSALQCERDDQSCIMIHNGQINSDEHRVFTCITFARWHGLYHVGMQTARITDTGVPKIKRPVFF